MRSEEEQTSGKLAVVPVWVAVRLFSPRLLGVTRRSWWPQLYLEQ